jgi:dTDP-4-dehydrorhamnose 3,5-epimerase
VKFLATDIPDVVVVEPVVHGDPRGFFLESWRSDSYREGGIDAHFVQDNHSSSVHGTLRGLHAQLAPHAQGKLVRVIEGEVYDVAVDIRRGSPSFGRYVAAVLSAENFRQIWVPPGFAHGFCVTSERAQVEYKCTATYAPECELAVAWDDPGIGIPWPVRDPILSDRDQAAPRLVDVGERLPRLGEERGEA